MENFVSLICAVVFAVVGIYAVIKRRLVFAEPDDELQVYLYGWRAVAIGCLALVLSALCFCSAEGLVVIKWQ